MKESKKLVSGYLERISSRVFDDYHDEITELVAKHHGVYALYKRDRLYYVGLATNLRKRVSHHLKDRHKKKWDTFSLFLISDVRYLRQLESLIVHVAEPKGNLQRGRFAGSENLQPTLRHLITEGSKRNIARIFGQRRKTKGKNKRNPSRQKGFKGPILKGMFTAGDRLRALYKKAEYFCTVDAEGKIHIDNSIYNSPSAAAFHIRKKPTNGWKFWSYADGQGQWKKLSTLRK